MIDDSPVPPAEYAGWVPTITGHLSFGMIGRLGPNWSHANAESRDQDGLAVARHVLVHFRRTARDLPYSGWPVYWLLPGIRADYYLIGMSDAATRPVLAGGDQDSVLEAEDAFGVLKGELIAVPYHEEAVVRRRVNALRNEVRRRLLRFSDLDPEPPPATILKLYEDVDELVRSALIEGVVMVRAGFELYRTGELRIRMPELPPTAPSPQGLTKEEVRDLLARGLYYFAKDAVHRHYHHHPDTDNLTPLTRVVGDDDESWRRETLWGLARAVLEVRRRSELSDHQGALGMLAYADAFQALLARVRRRREGGFELATGIAPYDFAHTRASLGALIDDRRWSSSGWGQFWTVVVSGFLAVAALWIGAVQIQSPACRAVASPPAAVAGHAPAASAQPRPPPPAAASDAADPCETRSYAPAWAARTIIRIVHDPIGFMGVFAVVALIYFEFARRTLRAAAAGRLLMTSPLAWSIALGSFVSRRLRRVGILWGDQIANALLMGLVSLGLGFLANLFVLVLTRYSKDILDLALWIAGQR